MKLSYFTMPLHPLGRSYLETLNEDREAILLADELGFAEAFIGEHVTDLAETVTSCLSFIASLAYQTKTIKLGSGTLNLPNSHPAAVAAHVAMVDHMCNGRFIMGISPGGLRTDAEIFGNLDKDRNAMFAECIDMVLKIWSTDPPYKLSGDYWDISTERAQDLEIGQGEVLKPLQLPHPPIVVACMSPFSNSASNATAHDWSIISANFLQPIWVKSHWDKMIEGWQQSGRQPDPGQWRIAKSIFVAEDQKTADAYAKDPNGPYAHYYKSLMRKLIGNGRPDLFKTHPDMPDADITLEFVLDSLVIAGTPDHVAGEVLSLREQVGDFGTLVYAGHDWADKELSRLSMRLMAEEVMPKVNRALR
jgi:alkanesulfonate monooxygenase SsuD/methylene tetrahydromethanopterin reductase-like flavin-dependent oxidoreductase (luciferase family)